MPVLHSPDSEYAKERRKHEALHSEFGAPGKPYVFQPYPTMMYKAGLNDKSQVAILDSIEATTERERREFEKLGFVHGGQGAAVAAFERQRQEMAVLAAKRNFEDRNMSEEAKSERDVVEARSSEHLGAIPPAHPKTGRRE
jgi:hypothetical protein